MSDQTEDRANVSQTDEEVDPPTQTDGGDVEEQDAAEEISEEEMTDEQRAEKKLEELKEKIGVVIEDIGTLRQRLTVTVPGDLITERLDHEFTELQRERDVRGFRRGRAPRRLVEKAYGTEVRDLFKDQIVSQAYLAGTEKHDVKVLGDPDLKLDEIELPDEGDLEFSCEVEIRPEFEMPELTGIPVRKPVVTVSDEDVDLQIERLRMRFGHYDPAEDGQIQLDDIITGDVKMTVGDEVIQEETNIRFPARPSRVNDVVVEKLGDELAGAKVGDERSIEVAVPDDHEDEKLRGQTAKFEFAIREIRRQVLPPLNDEFAQMVGLDSISELRTMVRAESESRIDEEVNRGMGAQIQQYLLDNTDFEVPPGLSSRQTDRIVQRRRVEMQSRGMPEAEVDKQADELQTQAREQAASQLKLLFILEQIAEQFEIDVSEEEINGQLAQIAQASGRRLDRVRDEMMRRDGLQSVFLTIRDEKCIARLLKDAKVAEVTPEEAGQQADATGQDDAKPTDQADEDLADET